MRFSGARRTPHRGRHKDSRGRQAFAFFWMDVRAADTPYSCILRHAAQRSLFNPSPLNLSLKPTNPLAQLLRTRKIPSTFCMYAREEQEIRVDKTTSPKLTTPFQRHIRFLTFTRDADQKSLGGGSWEGGGCRKNETYSSPPQRASSSNTAPWTRNTRRGDQLLLQAYKRARFVL